MSNKKDKNTENQVTEEHIEASENPNTTTEAGDAAQKSTEEMSEVDTLREEVNQWRDKYLRLYADFDNYRKRTMKEKSEIVSTAGADIIQAMLPVLDDMERALQAGVNQTDISVLVEGVDLIHKKLVHNLKSKGLEPIESKGLPFDADLHEAITTIPAPNADLAGKIIDETEKGYRLNGHVIRFAKVVVGQ